MRVCHIAKSATWIKWLAAGFLLSVLAACGGGSSSSKSIGGNPLEFDAMGADGPLVDALIEAFLFQTWLADPATTDTLLAATSINRSDAEGLASGVKLVEVAATGPLILQFSGASSDLTTGLPPVVNEVRTIITASQWAQIPRPRFYATALTTLALERAIQLAGGGLPSSANLATASTEIFNAFGFRALEGDTSTPPTTGTPTGLPQISTLNVFTTSPILDEDTASLADQQAVAAYRTALEAFAQLVESVASTLGSGTTAQQVFDAILADFSVDGFVGNDASPTAIESAVVAEADTVDNNYLSGRVPSGVETLLDGETAAAAPLAGSLANIVPQEPDFDGDGVGNVADNNDYSTVQDADLDGVADGDDNCLTAPNGPLIAGFFGENQRDLDSDGDGDSCDVDADGDGVDGPIQAPAGPDVDDEDSAIAVDADNDGWDDDGDSNPQGFFNATHPEGAGTADNCVVGDQDAVNGGLLDATTAANPGQENLDFELPNTPDDLGDICDPDQDGDGEDRAEVGGLDLFDRDPVKNSNNHDNDTINTLGGNGPDNCPQTANQDQTAAVTPSDPLGLFGGPGAAFGIACDFDDDGFASPDQDVVGVAGEIGDGIPEDNCPIIANSGQEDDDADAQGDLCDIDNDNDGLPNALASVPNSIDRDPAEFNSVSTYLFDTFYFQQSGDSAGTGNFKLATVSESVLSGAGSIAAVAGTDHLLDVGADGNNDNTYPITASSYSTVENSLAFSGAGFGAASALPVTNEELFGAGSNTTTVSYSTPNLSLQGAALFPWGNTAFVGSGRDSAGRPDLPEVGSTLANGADQALTSLLFIDQNNAPSNATLAGTYGVVDMAVSYNDPGLGGFGPIASHLVGVVSRIYDMALNGGGVVTAGSNGQYDALIGHTEADSSVTYSTTAVAETGYTVAPSAAVTFIGSGMQGITSADGSLVAISQNNMRGYAVQLGSGVSEAELIGQTFNLTGLVIQPDIDSIATYTLAGATLSFSDAGAGQLTASLNYGSSTRAAYAFEPTNAALPAPGVALNPAAGNSLPFNIDDSGRIEGPIVFGADEGQRRAELEGFFVPGKGLLLRYIETNFGEVGGGGSTVNFFGGFLPQDLVIVGGTGACSDLDAGGPVEFVEWNSVSGTYQRREPQPACPDSSYTTGFVRAGAAGTLTKLSQLARGDEGSAKLFSELTAAPGAILKGDGFGQGIVWGIPQ